MITCFRHYNILVKSRSRIPWHYKLGTLFLRLLLETEPSWSSQPRRGPAACSPKGLPSFLSYSLKPVSRVRSRELNPRPPALQSNALPTELILSGLIIPESRSLPCYSFNASGSPLEDFILYFLKWSWSVCHFSQPR